MGGDIRQGDILKVETIQYPIYVASKDFFNNGGKVIGVPVLKGAMEGPLHIAVNTPSIEGFVCCEELRLLDLNVRGYKRLEHIPIVENMNIVDAIQGIFDYI